MGDATKSHCNNEVIFVSIYKVPMTKIIPIKFIMFYYITYSAKYPYMNIH